MFVWWTWPRSVLAANCVSRQYPAVHNNRLPSCCLTELLKREPNLADEWEKGVLGRKKQPLTALSFSALVSMPVFVLKLLFCLFVSSSLPLIPLLNSMSVNNWAHLFCKVPLYDMTLNLCWNKFIMTPDQLISLGGKINTMCTLLKGSVHPNYT